MTKSTLWSSWAHRFSAVVITPAKGMHDQNAHCSWRYLAARRCEAVHFGDLATIRINRFLCTEVPLPDTVGDYFTGNLPFKGTSSTFPSGEIRTA